MSFVYQIRRDTAANWTAANPTLLQGEWALETDTDRVKMGDGTTAWNSLAYFTAEKANIASPALTGTPTAPTASAGTNTTQLATTAFVASAIAAAAPGTGSITSDMIANGAIVDADVSASAAIAQSKIANLTSDLSAKAPLESPSLTGTPTAPTAASGTSTTQVATTAFVQGAVADLVDGAPGALNTLNELAAALSDDASFASTVTSALATKAPSASPTFTGTVTTPLTTAGFVTTSGSGVLSSTAEVAQASVTGLVGDLAAKAPLESPALTGTPTAPTATGGTNTTQVATTAFVTAAVAAATPGTGSITSDMIANGSIVNEDISASAAIAQSKIDGLGASLDAKPDLFIADSTPGSLGSGDFWLDTSATI